MEFEKDFTEIEIEEQIVTPVKPTIKPISVSHLLKKVQENFRERFWGVYLVAEISSLKYSGRHAYLTFKDTENDAMLNATLWNYQFSFEEFARKTGCQVSDFVEGATVEVYGEMTVYEPRGSMQLNISKMRIAGGMGEQLTRIQKIKEFILSNNWHLPQFKKAIPKFPHTVGIISSSNAAGVKDMLNVFKVEAPDIKIVIYECNVQGAKAVKSIVKSLSRANEEQRCDLLIIGRGGGAFEDLLAFSDLEVVEAVFNSQIPIISAVGHEIDNPLTDLVADAFCVTPTAAAKLVCHGRVEYRIFLRNVKQTIEVLKNNYFARRLQVLQNLDQRVSYLDPQRKFLTYINQFQDYLRKLDYILFNSLRHKQIVIGQTYAKLESIWQGNINYFLKLSGDYKSKVETYNPVVIVERQQQYLYYLCDRLNQVVEKKLEQKSALIKSIDYNLTQRVERDLFFKQKGLEFLKNKLESYNLRGSLQREKTNLQVLSHGMQKLVETQIRQKDYSLQLINSRLKQINIQYKLNQYLLLTTKLKQQLDNLLAKQLRQKANKLSYLLQRIEINNPKLPLSRGYAMLVDQNNRPLTSISQIQNSQKVEVIMQDGSFEAQAYEIKNQSSFSQLIESQDKIERLKNILEQLKQ
ncbi:exodeoxyribonuclease VII large subunit [Psittacicella gerlachiana]|uniref:Exodeoxyribonuclease 7 large subunit n=1 Tax=Psittacicella gerlachiana TaxID=2028574 RepID=A0A3A1YLG1_9GAMM|nr:exodeoxyribonuclease VII large subunit [Psittacicella gerlachiana]RIY37840.1 exodeoxyribonuclease VII large subunit [Psittacicella gerlachiana]